MRLIKLHYKIFSLIKYFSKNDFIIHSVDLYLLYGLNFLNKEELFKLPYFNKKNPSLKIYFNENFINFDFKKEYLGIPIFPPLKSKYNKLFLKMLDLYLGGKIDFIILKEEEYKMFLENTFILEGFRFSNIYNIGYILNKNIYFKLNNEISKLGYKDLYLYILKFTILLKFFKLDFGKEYDLIVNIFKRIDKIFGRRFRFIPGNKSIDNYEYIGIARFLDRDNIKITNKFLNEFYSGDIIIAENTNISYMKYLLKCGGIITVNNNVLSHASIVSRELGLPLILGAENIFLKVFDGDEIKINSLTGEINVLKRFWEL